MIMAFVWLTVISNWYMLIYLTNTFERVYVTGLATNFADVAGYTFSGLLYKSLGLKRLLLYFNLFALVGGIIILTYGLKNQDSWTFAFLILLTKGSMTCMLNGLFVGHSSIFPVLFATTSFGICMFLGRLFTTMSPIVAQIEQPLPM